MPYQVTLKAKENFTCVVKNPLTGDDCLGSDAAPVTIAKNDSASFYVVPDEAGVAYIEIVQIVGPDKVHTSRKITGTTKLEVPIQDQLEKIPILEEILQLPNLEGLAAKIKAING
jgi:hypothetical protein